MMVFSRRVAVMTALLLVWIAPADAACPNKCSGHGACGANDVCTCKQNWMGGDCSLRVCPYTRAWVDAAQNNNDAHYYAECGNKGSCDRSTGICNCDSGYTGSGCRRQACPNDCSGHGTCEFIQELTSNTYTLWDEEKIMGCKCDPGFEGHDCSSRICPKGDDPITSYDQNNMMQFIKYTPGNNGAATGDYGNIYLSYADPYGKTWTTSSITVPDGSTTPNNAGFCANVQTALRNIPNMALKSITVEVLSTASLSPSDQFSVVRTTNAVSSGTLTATAITYTTADQDYACKITFPSAPGTTGLQSVFTCSSVAHDTNGMQPKVSNGASDSCDTGEFVSANAARKLTELATCSNRGICDGSTGDCQCFAGHRGLACETQEALV